MAMCSDHHNMCANYSDMDGISICLYCSFYTVIRKFTCKCCNKSGLISLFDC